MKTLQALRQDFVRAPLWQKIVLVLLCSFLLYWFIVLPLIHSTLAFVQEYDDQRDQAFRRMQQAQYVIDDTAVISKNYMIAQVKVSQELVRPDILLRQIKQKVYGATSGVYMYEAAPDHIYYYGGIARVPTAVRAHATSSQVINLIEQLERTQAFSFETVSFNQGTLAFRSVCLANAKLPLNIGGKAWGDPKNIRAMTKTVAGGLRLQAVLLYGGEQRAIIDGRVVSRGDSYAGCTIIDINAKTKQVIIEQVGKTRVLRIQ